MTTQQIFRNSNINDTNITCTSPNIISSINTSTPISPFLQWVGGKRRIADKLQEKIPPGLGLSNYYEPFLGGGALFFQVRNRFNRCVRCMAVSQ